MYKNLCHTLCTSTRDGWIWNQNNFQSYRTVRSGAPYKFRILYSKISHETNKQWKPTYKKPRRSLDLLCTVQFPKEVVRPPRARAVARCTVNLAVIGVLVHARLKLGRCGRCEGCTAPTDPAPKAASHVGTSQTRCLPASRWLFTRQPVLLGSLGPRRAVYALC